MTTWLKRQRQAGQSNLPWAVGEVGGAEGNLNSPAPRWAARLSLIPGMFRGQASSQSPKEIEMSWCINIEGICYRDWLQVIGELRRQMRDSEQARD